ncbi:MAG: hypothetical protein K0Q51_389 [Rickettsiaceae bacterium]|jgi:uncharacterized membrane protein YuzA (DUF378 family)|nr:hypothetical protein [Rickettsiaceae bacterium]
MKNFYYISLILAVIGSINWGLVGLADFNLVARLFGDYTALTKIIYALVGLAGINLLFASFIDNPPNTTLS